MKGLRYAQSHLALHRVVAVPLTGYVHGKGLFCAVVQQVVQVLFLVSVTSEECYKNSCW